MVILDCTLRDGGYYNAWIFHPRKPPSNNVGYQPTVNSFRVAGQVLLNPVPSIPGTGVEAYRETAVSEWGLNLLSFVSLT
jgi:hypothetical protein